MAPPTAMAISQPRRVLGRRMCLRPDQAGGVGVALVIGQQGQAAAQEDDVHPGVLACQGGEAVGGHLLPEAEVADQECRRGGHVGDVEGHGGGGDLHGGLLGLVERNGQQ